MIRNLLNDPDSFLFTAVVTLAFFSGFCALAVYLFRRHATAFKAHEELPFDDEK